MRRRYNIALIPAPAYASLLTQTARQLFEGKAQGYLLGPRALPHVTLSQFHARSDAHAQQVFDSCPRHWMQAELVPQEFYLRPHGEVAHCFNAGIGVVKSLPLEAMQAKLHAQITANGGDVLTPAGAKYLPHFTLAFVADTALTLPALDARLWDVQSAQFALGRCDAVGQMPKVMKLRV